MIDKRKAGALGVCAALLLVANSAVSAAAVPGDVAVRGIPREGPTVFSESCSCLEDFERLVSLAESSYIGFPLLVRDARADEYRANLERLRKRAGSAVEDDCIFVLRAYTDWFGDGHLFVSEQSSLPADSTAALTRSAPADPRGEAELRAYLDARGSTLDPVEGIWFTNRGARYAVVQRADAPGKFIAITLHDPAAAWSAGHVKAWLAGTDGDAYDVRFLAEDRSKRNFTAVIQRDMLLHMPPITWGREYPARSDAALIDPRDPRAPLMRTVRNGVLLLSIPSHAPEHRSAIDSLVSRHHDALLAAELLIIDLRGNEGGSSMTTTALVPYLATRHQQPRLGPDRRMAVLTSEENIRFFAGMGVPEPLLEKMRAASGGVFMIQAEYDALTGYTGEASRDDIAETGPRHVAIVTDRHTVSAAEAFVLDAARNTKVTLLGENSGGVIDLQNVRMVRLACPDRGLLLGYPTVAASDRLPEGGLNATGVPVQIELDVRHADIVSAVLGQLGPPY